VYKWDFSQSVASFARRPFQRLFPADFLGSGPVIFSSKIKRFFEIGACASKMAGL
jgi:hypothetical protein